MPDLRRVGRDAEDRAASYLIEKGYTIVTRRYSTRVGEIDVIALDGEVLVFVEVKERRTSGYIPEEAVGPKKVARIGRAAAHYVAKTNDRRSVRFDLIAIDSAGIRHYEGCFEQEGEF